MSSRNSIFFYDFFLKRFYKYILFIFIFFGNICISQQKNQAHPETYVAYKISEAITIDGRATEEAWKRATWTKNFIDIEGIKIPKYQTNVKMVWDENYFYIYADIKEPHVWGNLKQRDTVIFYNNDFEVFIDPTGDTHNYYEIEINALNTVWDLYIEKPYRELGNIVLNDWNSTNLESAVYVNGTINNASDIDNGWTIEIAVPFKDLRTSYMQDNIPKNKFWRVNFSRVNWTFSLLNGKYSRKKDDSGEFSHEYNWVWSPQWVINMHEPEHWGYVYFSTQPVGSKVQFTIPIDDKIKYQLYKIYRAQKKYYNKNKRWCSSLKFLGIVYIIVDGQAIVPSLEFHKSGWNLIVVSPFTNKTLIIKEDGKFISK